MKMVTRSVFTSTIEAVKVRYEKGAIVEEAIAPVVVNDAQVANDDDAIKHVRRATGDKKAQYVVKSIAITSKTYGVALDVFMSNAKEIVKAEKQAEGDANTEVQA